MNLTDLKTIGILSGMSSIATGEYYNLINNNVRETLGGLNIAEMVIVSVNFGNIERFVRTENWEEAGEYLFEKAKRIEAAGADCLFLATNTFGINLKKQLQFLLLIFLRLFQKKSLKTVNPKSECWELMQL